MRNGFVCEATLSGEESESAVGRSALFSPSASRSDASDDITIAALFDGDGAVSALARRLAGQRIALAGYLAPALIRTASCFMLADAAGAPCALCGGHSAGAEILIVPDQASKARSIPMFERVTVTGLLSLGPEGVPVVTAATLERASDTDWLARAVGARNAQWRESARSRAKRRPGIEAGQAKRWRRRPARPAAGPADTIWRNGRIHTMDASGATVEAVAIRDGLFLAAGSSAEIGKFAGPDTQTLDLAGRTAIPGLIDSHLHQLMLAFNLPNVNLLGARSVADVQALIGARAAETPKGEWVVASSGWHESLLAEGRMPTRWEIDAAAPDHPVIIPRGGHVVTLNSKALEQAGVGDDTPDPRGGVIVRDKQTGQATGVLLETAAYFGRRVAPLFPKPEAMDGLLEAAMRELNSYGIVSVIDPVVDETTIGAYKRLRDAGKATVRSDLLYKVSDKAEADKAIPIMLAQHSDQWVRFAGLKFMADGGVEGARLRDPYRIVPGEQPDPDYRGLLILPPGGEEEFVDLLEAAAAAGLQVQVHGVGDETIDVIARSFEAIAQKYDIANQRWCLMHAFLPSQEAIDTLLRLGLPVTVQDHPVLLGHNQRRWWGDERAGEAIPVRRLIEAGLLVGGGTDGPVAPVDPFLSMWWMTTRQTLLGYALGPEQAISARQALELYTINNARILGLEDERGSIEPGKLADMTVLSQDILAIDPDEIRNTKALMTMVGGKVVYRRDI